MQVELNGLDPAEWARFIKVAEMCDLSLAELFCELVSRGRRFPSSRAVRFWYTVDFSSECWLWQGYCRKDGYGRYNDPLAKGQLAHRIAWELIHGPVDEGIHVLHSCDTPPCVRPGHLYLGAHLENMQDKVRKGRQGRRDHGSSNHASKLTDQAVLDMRERWESGEWSKGQLGRWFGVSRTRAGLIVERKAWTHI